MRKIVSALAFAGMAMVAMCAPTQAADVICYNCPPEWADWASMLKAIKSDLGFDIPFDNKNSGQSLSQIIAEKDNPVADVVYYGVNFGMKAKTAGVIEPEAMTPNPPALEIAATRWRSDTQVIAPPIMARSVPRKARPRAQR